MVDIKCLICEESLEIPPYIDTENYDGQLYCRACQLLWDVKLVESKVRKFKVAEKQTKPRPSNITMVSSIPRPSDSEQKE
jgi:hypothetical protein